MNENISPFTPTKSTASLESAATEFRTKVEDAATRLNGAAEQFVSMSEGFATAISEARKAADRAVAAQRSVEEMRDRLERDYGVVSTLVADLQDRISALATLARPLPAEPQAQEPATEIAEAKPEPISIIPDRPDAADRDTIVW
jgi:hypothetical protein